MELQKNRFALASAATMGIIYVVCAAFVSLFPDFSLKLFGWLVHLVNVDKFAGGVAVTVGGFMAGLAQIFVYTYGAGYLFASLHNRFMVHKE